MILLVIRGRFHISLINDHKRQALKQSYNVTITSHKRQALRQSYDITSHKRQALHKSYY